jgi:hypothetical protein
MGPRVVIEFIDPANYHERSPSKSPSIPLFQRGKLGRWECKDKKSQVRHLKKLRYSVPLFEKEGPGEICLYRKTKRIVT